MAMQIRVYYEGTPALRPGMQSFIVRGLSGSSSGPLRVYPVGCGDASRAAESFELALVDHPEALNILLIDAEAEVTCEFGKPWEHLGRRDEVKLARPRECRDEQVHLMVQVMESWFLADKESLAGYYGDGFAAGRLPARPDVENVPKRDVARALHSATAKTRKKPYDKTAHAPFLLQSIDPAKVRAASPWCNRLFETIEKLIGTQ